MAEQAKICSICKKEYFGWGNNAQPVNDGRCCDNCNTEKVIPARLAIFFADKESQKADEKKWKQMPAHCGGYSAIKKERCAADMITDRELKEYALIGLLVRINAEKEKLTKQTEPKAKVMIETRIDRMTQIYESLLYELRQAAE